MSPKINSALQWLKSHSRKHLQDAACFVNRLSVTKCISKICLQTHQELYTTNTKRIQHCIYIKLSRITEPKKLVFNTF